MKGGVILFRGSGAAARRYVEADRSRADEYYLGADDAVAEYTVLDASGEVTATRSLTVVEYEGWVDWRDPVTGESMGIPRNPGEGSKGSPLFAEMTINAPKSLSVAAALRKNNDRYDTPGSTLRWEERQAYSLDDAMAGVLRIPEEEPHNLAPRTSVPLSYNGLLYGHGVVGRVEVRHGWQVVVWDRYTTYAVPR